jgi:N12 class adenine-specific DNA methylase
LIDSAEEVNGKPPSCPSEYAPGFVPTKATLVIVPSHLMSQWPKEITKFLGNKQVCVINTMANFNKLTVEMVQKADIVVVNFQRE